VKEITGHKNEIEGGGVVCFHGRLRQATDVLQPAGLSYRPLWTFQLWPPDAPAFRTLAAEVGTYEFFYMPQICDMGPTALLPFRRKACGGFFRS
jgi:hypothetical protein